MIVKGTIRAIIIFAVIVVISGLFIIIYYGPNTPLDSRKYNLKRSCEAIKKDEFQGEIIKKFYDKSNRGLFKVILKKGRIINEYYIYSISNPDSVFLIGDKIIKNKNSLDFIIYRNGHKNYIKSDDDFYCNTLEN